MAPHGLYKVATILLAVWLVWVSVMHGAHLFGSHASLPAVGCSCLQAVSRRLVQLAADAAAAQQRSKAGSDGTTRTVAAVTGGLGSVEHTTKVGAMP